jgi:hypothetical protein
MSKSFEGDITEPSVVESRYYSWNFPGAPIKVELELGVVDRIRREMDAVTGEGAETKRGGLLLGETRNGVVFITDCEPVEPSTVAAFEAAVERLKSAGEQPDAVGFYRIDRSESLRLQPEDVEIARKVFPAPEAVVLLAQPRPQSLPAATFFFREGGQLLGEFAFLEFPFDSQLLEIERRGKQAAQACEPSVEIAAAPAHSLRRWRVRVPLSALAWTAAVLALAAVGAAAVWFVSQTRAPASPTTSGIRQAAGFGLRAERSGADYILSWNRTSPAVTSALWGLLSIEDGGSRRDISLQADQLRSGSILYQPTGEEIRFKLSLVAPDQHVETESVTVIRPPTTAPPVNAGSRRTRGAGNRAPRNSATEEAPSPATPATAPESASSQREAPAENPSAAAAEAPGPGFSGRAGEFRVSMVATRGPVASRLGIER